MALSTSSPRAQHATSKYFTIDAARGGGIDRRDSRALVTSRASPDAQPAGVFVVGATSGPTEEWRRGALNRDNIELTRTSCQNHECTKAL